MSLWTLDDGRIIRLIRPKELYHLTKGTRLFSISGKEVVLGKDLIDDDTRGGFLGYGLPANFKLEPSRPDRDHTLLDVARIIATRGTCSRAKVGAVVAKEGRILVTGYNGAPAGMPHCIHDTDEACTVAVHAEANAVAYAARYGMSLENSDLYTTLSPCLACAQLIINSGITRVIYSSSYRDTIGVDLLRDAGLVLDYIE